MNNKLMKVDEAVAYLAGRGVKISRRGFYGWLKVGVRGVKLQHGSVPNAHPTAKDRNVVVVSPQQLNDFLAAIGVGGAMA